MGLYELHRKESYVDADCPLRSLHVRINAEADFGGASVPGPVQRRLIVQALRQILEKTGDEDITILSNPIVAFTQRQEENGWAKPEDMDLRVIKSAHRIVSEVAKRSQSGRVVLAADLVGAIGLSAPTIGRLLRLGERANDYLSQFVVISPHGRTKALDLTPRGRLMASKIRAGVVPA